MTTNANKTMAVLVGVLLLILMGAAGVGLLWLAEDRPTAKIATHEVEPVVTPEPRSATKEPKTPPPGEEPVPSSTEIKPEPPEPETIEKQTSIQVTVEGTVSDSTFSPLAGATVAVSWRNFNVGRKVEPALGTTQSKADGSFTITFEVEEADFFGRSGRYMDAWASYSQSENAVKRYSELSRWYLRKNDDQQTATASDVFVMILENREIDVLALGEEGTPVPGATVWWQPNIYERNGILLPDSAGVSFAPDGVAFETKTSANGLARLTVPASAGNQCVLVVADSYMPAFEFVPPPRRDIVERVELTLTRAAGPVKLEITDSEARPVPSREVAVRFYGRVSDCRYAGSSLRGELRTDEFGTCVVPDFPTLDWLRTELGYAEKASMSMTVNVEGYDESVHVILGEGLKSYSIQLPPNRAKWLDRRYRFVDENGIALEYVHLENIISQTGPEVRGFRPYANGRWLEVSWPPEIEEIEVELETRSWVELTFTVKVTPGEDRDQIITIVRPVASHHLTGQVKTADGMPVENAIVKIREIKSKGLWYSGDDRAFTDAEGRYEYRIQFPGKETLTIQIGVEFGSIPPRYEEKVLKAGDNEIDFVLPETAPLRVIVDAELAKAFPVVRIVDEHGERVGGGRAQTPDVLEWTIENAPLGKLKAYVTTSQAGLLLHENDPHVVEVEVKAGETNVLNLGSDAQSRPVAVRVQMFRNQERLAPEAEMVVKCVRIAPDYEGEFDSWTLREAMNWDYQVRPIEWSAQDEAMLTLLPGRYIILRFMPNARKRLAAEGAIMEIVQGPEQSLSLELEDMEITMRR